MPPLWTLYLEPVGLPPVVTEQARVLADDVPPLPDSPARADVAAFFTAFYRLGD